MPQTLSLPDLETLDPAALKAMILHQHAHAKTQQAQLSSRENEIERLVLLVEKLQRMLFGTKSEKVLRQIEQLELQLEELQAASAVEEIKDMVPGDRPASARPFRRPLPEHLPREIHTHMPRHEACPDCGGKLRELGEDVAEMLEYIRASFKVLRHVRPELRCVRPDRAGASSLEAHRSWPRRPRPACPCDGVEVCGPPSALPTVRDLRS